MKIRCTECQKKIMIDEAFAGGVCRCPYCKAIVFVPGRATGGAGAFRPEAPTSRPQSPVSRPESPTAQLELAVQQTAESEEQYIPTADPVRLQGIVSIVLLALVLAMIGGTVWLGIHIFGGGLDDTKQEGENPQTTWKPDNAPDYSRTIKPDSPVVYCLDAGDVMFGSGNGFNYAEAMTRDSIKLLRSDQQFNIVLCGEKEEDDKLFQADYLAGGKEAQEKAIKFLGEAAQAGLADLSRGLTKALEKKPRTIVLFTAQNVQGLLPLAEQAKARGVRILTFAMPKREDVDLQPEVKAAMEQLARATGGDCKAFATVAEMEDWVKRLPGK